MKICDFSARFLIAVLTLGIGMGNLLLSHFGFSPLPRWIGQFDSSCATAFFPSKSRVFDYAADTQEISVRALGNHPEQSLPFQVIDITDDPHRIFETSPPSPLDYAVILQHLLDQGCRSVVITTRMAWDTPKKRDNSLSTDSWDESFDEAKLSPQALSYKLAQFDRAVIGLPVTRGAVAHTLPQTLQRSLITRQQIHGNDKLIPKINQASLPTSIEGGPNTLAGFSVIESAPSDPKRIQLLAHWISDTSPQDDGFIPSLALLTIMSAHGIAPSELQVQCGQHIRLGQTGPIIPIDEYGQTPRTESLSTTAALSSGIPADQLITSKSIQLNNKLCLIRATGEKSSRTNLLKTEHLSQLVTLSQTLPTLGDPVIYQKLNFGFECLIILGITLIAAAIITLTPQHRNIAYALALLLLVIILLVLMTWKHQWVGLTAPTLTLISAWLISSQLKPTPPPEN